MKIGVISDTHDNLDITRKAVNILESEEADAVIHCGDMIAPFTAELFDSSFDFYAVRGNNDGEWNLKSTVEDFGTWMGDIGELEINGKSIGVYHGTDEEIVEGLARKDYDYLFRGHTHKTKTEEHGQTIELNPGGIQLPDQEEDFHFATVELEEDKIQFHEVS